MRLLLTFALILLSWASHAASVTLMWEPSPDSNAVGYAVYYGTVGTPTPTRMDVGNVTNCPVNNLQPGLTYFFYVTAYDSARNESDPSNVINYTVPDNPMYLRVYCSTNVLGPWRELTNLVRWSYPTNTYRVRMTIRR